jgi:uncharacterized protein (DUF1501 family)
MMHSFSRRDFLSLCLKGSVSLAGLSSLQLQAMTGLASQGPLDDYKALVCVYLFGGSDSLNMLVPLGGEQLTGYLASRQTLAVQNPLALTPTTSVEGGVGFHPALAPLMPLFNQQRLGLVSGVGSLISPLTLAQYKQGGAQVPRYLFSHNDQQATWMQGREKASINYGWGGRLLEMLEQNTHFASNISLNGNNLWQTAASTTPFAMNSSGVTKINPYSSSSQKTLAFRAQLEQMFAEASHPLASSYSNKFTQSITNTELLNQSLANATELDGLFSDNSFSKQLKAVAKTLSVQPQLGVGRQVFFISMGGFDTHDNQVTTQPALLAQLAQGLAEFDGAMTELNLQNQVTSFTMSDFGRTLSSNGDGTDHGWAGNQLVMGGAVKGGDIYGALLPQILKTQFDVGGGRLIPQIANEQYFASLAQWFGASRSGLNDLFPNLSNFNQQTLPIFGS